MKKYLIALSLVGLATTSCYEKLNIAPPNAITDEQVQALLKTADEATVVTILGGMADNIRPSSKAAVIPRSTTNISTTTRHSSFAAI